MIPLTPTFPHPTSDFSEVGQASVFFSASRVWWIVQVENCSTYWSVRPFVEQVQLLYVSFLTRMLCSWKDPWVICWLLKSEKQCNKSTAQQVPEGPGLPLYVASTCAFKEEDVRWSSACLANWLIDFTPVKCFKWELSSRLWARNNFCAWFVHLSRTWIFQVTASSLHQKILYQDALCLLPTSQVSRDLVSAQNTPGGCRKPVLYRPRVHTTCLSQQASLGRWA